MKKNAITIFVFLMFIAAPYTSDADNTQSVAAPATTTNMVFVKGGCFEMGNSFKKYFSNEQPPHQVCVNDFLIASYEVTQKQWKSVMGRNPSYFKRCDNCPVENISWHSANTFIKKLNKKTSGAYRLPTEAEWEYAAKGGGKKQQWPGTNEKKDIGQYIIYHGFARQRPHPVGQKKPNELGLYDMGGNISEWVSDWFSAKYYKISPKDNPTGPAKGRTKVHRGGSWDVPCPERVRTTRRRWEWPGEWNNFTGLRLARTPAENKTAEKITNAAPSKSP